MLILISTQSQKQYSKEYYLNEALFKVSLGIVLHINYSNHLFISKN